MPVYEYRCLECKKEFERIRPLSDRGTEKIKCPECGSSRLERRWSRVFAVTSKKS